MRGARSEVRGRKLVGESKPKAQLKPQARPLSEISENESKTKFELNEDSFLVNEAESFEMRASRRRSSNLAKRTSLADKRRSNLAKRTSLLAKASRRRNLSLASRTSLEQGLRCEGRGPRSEVLVEITGINYTLIPIP